MRRALGAVKGIAQRRKITRIILPCEANHFSNSESHSRPSCCCDVDHSSSKSYVLNDMKIKTESNENKLRGKH